MLGGLAYLISELDDDFYYVNLLDILLKTFYKDNDMVSVFEASQTIKAQLGFNVLFNINSEEISRYNGFYQRIYREIEQLPAEYLNDGGIGYRQTVNHKSEFIKQVASNRFFEEDECQNGFIDWLKEKHRQEKLVQIKKLINILKQL